MSKPIEFTDLEEFIVNHKAKWREIITKDPFNITVKKVYEDLYDDIYMFSYPNFGADFSLSVVRACRGCVYRINEKEIIPICLPYTKFTNYGERKFDDLRHDWSSNIITEKIDGSLIKLVKYQGKLLWFLNNSCNFDVIDTQQYHTDGTLTFKQLLERALKNKKLDEKYVLEGWTYMFELVSPNHKIVCEYSEDTLYFHGVRDKNGVEHDVNEIEGFDDFPKPKRAKINTYSDVLKEIEKINGHNSEGFVAIDKNYHRLKIKCEEYLKLHKIRSTLQTEKQILNFYFSGNSDDYPDYQDIITPIREKIENYRKIFNNIVKLLKELPEMDAIELCKKKKEFSRIYFFALRHGDEFDKLIQNYDVYKIFGKLEKQNLLFAQTVKNH